MGWRHWGGIVAVLTVGCSPVPPPPYDAGAPEAGGVDAAVADAGATDVGVLDSAAADAADTTSGAGDSGSWDAGAADSLVPDTATLQPDATTLDGADVAPPDTGTPDTGTPDTGTPDTPAVDTGTPDSQAFDTGTPDTNPSDAYSPDSNAADASVPDAGAADAGSPDAGAADTDTADAGATDAGPALPPGLGKSPCKLPGELPQAGAIELVDPFPKLSKTFGPLTFLTHPHDGSDRIVVVERKGVVWAFTNSATTGQRTKVIDVSAKVASQFEGGMHSVAFHPQFASNGRLFLSYTAYVSGQFSSVISEVQVDPKTLIAKLPTEKNVLVIPQPYGNHNGGQILFDKTGMLVIGMGDGGSAGDPKNSGQSPDTLLGAVLRIDVDTIPAGKTYGIPSDNPQKTGWKPELWAMGLRNPWRMSVDRKTGVLWAADVGQNKWEEVDLVPKGANLGWRTMEGNHCYNPAVCNKKGLHLPIFEYSHSLGYSITGGYVYRGKAWPSLTGMYLFGDYVSRRFWAIWREGQAWKSKVVLNQSWMSPVSFGEDRDGEVYVLSLTGSQKIARIQPKKGSVVGALAPEKLSQTGCFSALKPLKPAVGVVPYGVNTPLWSDGARKLRFAVLPAGVGGGVAKASQPADDQAPLGMPLGTILIKHFGLGKSGVAPQGTPVETRFMVLGKNGWVFWTYRWNAQGTDASLVMSGSKTAFSVAGSFQQQQWQQPSVSECATCHQGPQGTTPLGLIPAQLDGLWDYGGQVRNQLKVWQDEGLLTPPASGTPAVVAMPSQPWPKVMSKQLRSTHARAWLAVNCGSCHRPGGTAPSDMDLRMKTPLTATKACKVAPSQGDGGMKFAKIIQPGSPNTSILYSRIAAKPDTAWFMPHLGVTLPHKDGVALIKAWIQGLSNCN